MSARAKSAESCSPVMGEAFRTYTPRRRAGRARMDRQDSPSQPHGAESPARPAKPVNENGGCLGKPPPSGAPAGLPGMYPSRRPTAGIFGIAKDAFQFLPARFHQ